MKDMIYFGTLAALSFQAHCEAIKWVFVDGKKLGLLHNWLHFRGAVKRMTLESLSPQATQEEILGVGEHFSVVSQIEHLLSYPFVKQKVQRQELFASTGLRKGKSPTMTQSNAVLQSGLAASFTGFTASESLTPTGPAE